MNQFYPDGMRDIALNRANENGGLVTPPDEKCKRIVTPSSRLISRTS